MLLVLSTYLHIMSRTILLLSPGCDQGIGHATALLLDKLGFQVFAGCLFMGGEGERKLVKASSSRLQTFQMDVTNVQQVQEAAQLVADNLRGKGTPAM